MDNKTILFRRNSDIFSSSTRAEFRDSFDMIKRYKNIFRENQKITQRKKFFIKTPNMYRSFIYSSSPYNYLRIPREKNTFLICYNGGPKLYTYVEKDKLSEKLDKKDIINIEPKQCGCFKKLYVPKLTRSLSNFENYRRNDMQQFGFKRPLSGYNQPYLKNKIDYNNENCKVSSNSVRYNKNINRTLKMKKFDNKKNIYNFYYTNYLPNKKISFDNNRDNKKMLKRNKYDSLLYNMNKNIDKKFHKTQIFDHCKPFLSEGF